MSRPQCTCIDLDSYNNALYMQPMDMYVQSSSPSWWLARVYAGTRLNGQVGEVYFILSVTWRFNLYCVMDVSKLSVIIMGVSSIGSVHYERFHCTHTVVCKSVVSSSQP